MQKAAYVRHHICHNLNMCVFGVFLAIGMGKMALQVEECREKEPCFAMNDKINMGRRRHGEAVKSMPLHSPLADCQESRYPNY